MAILKGTGKDVKIKVEKGSVTPPEVCDHAHSRPHIL